jgi:hypothetical protein
MILQQKVDRFDVLRASRFVFAITRCFIPSRVTGSELLPPYNTTLRVDHTDDLMVFWRTCHI